MKIIHTDGKWLLNTANFSFTDGDSGVTFEAGVITKARETEWVKGQPCIKEVADPLTKPVEKPEKVAKK